MCSLRLSQTKNTEETDCVFYQSRCFMSTSFVRDGLHPRESSRMIDWGVISTVARMSSLTQRCGGSKCKLLRDDRLQLWRKRKTKNGLEFTAESPWRAVRSIWSFHIISLLIACEKHTHSYAESVCVSAHMRRTLSCKSWNIWGVISTLYLGHPFYWRPGIKTSSTGEEGSVSGNNWGNIACLEERATLLREGPESHFIFLPITFFLLRLLFFFFFFFFSFFLIKAMLSWCFETGG